MAPALPADVLPVSGLTGDNAAATETAVAISRGEVGNAISGTIALPINLRKLARFTDGAPPVTLHAFRVTGPLIREAKVSLFWKDDHAIGYVVDGVPPEYPVVLAATVEPGVVVRALVPKASTQRPARGQTISEKSDTIVLECYLNGIIPPVGLGGIAEVVRQGGLDPAGAAESNRLAAAQLESVSASGWGHDMRAAGEAASALKELAQAQLSVAGGLETGSATVPSSSMLTSGVYAATRQVQQKLLGLNQEVSERAKVAGIPPEVAAAIATAASHVNAAASTDVHLLTTVIPVSGTFSLAQRFENRLNVVHSARRLMDLYDEIGFVGTANTGFKGPNGKPFSEAEIDAAFTNGKGPYRTTCSQVNFYGDSTCMIATNPLDLSREVIISREADYLSKKLIELDSALSDSTDIFNDPRVASVFWEHPAVANFIADDQSRWTSPEGTWRIRLLQDVGAEEAGGAGLAVMKDAEMFITAAEKPPSVAMTTKASSGGFVGVLSIWTPSTEFHENLNNFGLRFQWDEQDRTLSDGQLRGERRDLDDGLLRTDYAATFNARMVENNRISGYWFSRERGMAGRFEMIRGTALYTI